MTTNLFWTGSYVPLFQAALRKVLPKLSAQVIENRETTIGGSEIGACPLKVIRSKRQPVPHDEETCMRFLLGHTRETSLSLVHDQVCADHGWYRVDQQRFLHPEHPRLRAHVDRTFMNAPTLAEATRVRVLEEKYPGYIPDGPWDSWVYQFQFQIGLIQENFPEKAVDGGPLITTHDRVADYGGVWELNRNLFSELVRKGTMMLRHLDDGTEPEPEPGLLCGYCPYRSNCPAFSDPLKVPISEQVLGRIARYKEVAAAKKALEEECKAIKTEIVKALWGRSPPRKFRGKAGEDLVLDYSVRNGRKKCDLDALQAEFPEAYKATVTPGESYDVLQVL